MKRLFLLILTVSSFSYSSPCEDTVKLLTESENRLLKSFEQALKDRDVNVRLSVLESLLEMGESALPLLQSHGLPLLRKVLKKRNIKTALKAIEIALKIGEPALPLLQSYALPILRKALSRSDVEVQLKAVELVIKIGEPARHLFRSKVVPLIEQMLSSLADGELRTMFLEKLEEIRIGEPALPLIEQMLSSSDVQVQFLAIWLLVEIGEPARDLLESKALPMIEEALSSSGFEVQFKAVELVIKIGEPALPLFQSYALPILRKALSSSDFEVKRKAVELLIKIGEPALPLFQSYALPILRKALSSSDVEIQFAAIGLLMKIGEPARDLLESQGIPLIEQMLSSSDVGVQFTAIGLLMNIGEPARDLLESKGFPIIEEALSSSQLEAVKFSVISQLVEASGGGRITDINEEEMENLAFEIINHEVLLSSQLKVLSLLVEIGEPARDLLESQGPPIIERALKSSDVEVQIEVFIVLTEIFKSLQSRVFLSIIDIIEEFLSSAGNGNDMKILAISLLVEIGEPARDLLESKGPPIIEQALKSSDIEVIENVKTIIERINNG